jgi:hypothetical protein
MSTRAELRIVCKELKINSEGLDKAQMVIKIKEEADKRFKKKWSWLKGADTLSSTLKKFLTEEAHFVIRDREGNELDHLGRIKKLKNRKKVLDKDKGGD